MYNVTISPYIAPYVAQKISSETTRRPRSRLCCVDLGRTEQSSAWQATLSFKRLAAELERPAEGGLPTRTDKELALIDGSSSIVMVSSIGQDVLAKQPGLPPCALGQ